MDTGRVVRAAVIAAAAVIVGAAVGVVVAAMSLCAGDGPEFPY